MPRQQEVSGPWKWSITHTRFGGHASGAEEKYIGADVVIEMVLRSPNRYSLDSKTLLLQAKKNWTTDSKIMEQAAKLSTWREAAAVINLTAGGFEAFRIDDVVAAKGRRPSRAAVRLSDFFTDEFVSGELGDETLSYDPRRALLQWVDMENTLVKCWFYCRNRLRVIVVRPTPPGPRSNAARIEPEEIHEHRLKATSAEILSVSSSPSAAELKSAYRRLQKIYHTDIHSSASDFVKRAMNRRSQEGNRAFAALRRER